MVVVPAVRPLTSPPLVMETIPLGDEVQELAFPGIDTVHCEVALTPADKTPEITGKG